MLAWRFIGLDEAGYGPNLGPLVIAATAWTLPEDPQRFDLYSTLVDVVSRERSSGGEQVHLADSKQVHQSSRGLAALESSALVLLRLAAVEENSVLTLLRRFSCLSQANKPESMPGPDGAKEKSSLPWRSIADIPLPVAADEERIVRLTDRLADCSQRAGCRLDRIAACVIDPLEFNRMLSLGVNKAALLSRQSILLARSLGDPADVQRTLIVGDKHGGRNRYDQFLSEFLDGEMVIRIEESREISRYRTGRTEWRFEARGEHHLPVACASIVAKYLRELEMLLWNRFWAGQLPGIKPTKGYPVDARRFRQQIAAQAEELGLVEQCWWRER